jgi:menaquinone-dependent protoporphyrinogen IX oxidase
MTAQFSIVYISPNGSTGKVAETLADRLAKGGASVNLTDLSVAGPAIL